MDDEQFFSDVESHADLDSHEQAVAAAEAVLGVLGERLDTAESLTDELPENLAGALGGLDAEAAGFTADEFVDWVREAEREKTTDIDPNNARLHTQAVFESLAQSADGETWNEVRTQLPDEYERLFQAG
jgi:uncharacterized protein (DUF2267 family)